MKNKIPLNKKAELTCISCKRKYKAIVSFNFKKEELIYYVCHRCRTINKYNKKEDIIKTKNKIKELKDFIIRFMRIINEYNETLGFYNTHLEELEK